MGELTSRLGLHKPTSISETFGSYFPDAYAADLEQIDDNIQIKQAADAGEIPVYDQNGFLVGSGVKPEDLEQGLDSLLTDQGMILYKGASALAALSPDTSGKCLLTQGTGANPLWGYLSHGVLLNKGVDDHTQYLLRSVLTTRGDIPFMGAAGWDRLGYGPAKQALRSGGAGADPTWGEPSTTRNIPFVIDGGGIAITAGIKGDLEIPFACNVVACTLLADQTGSIVVDVWKCTYAQFDNSTHPIVGDSITASAKPTISSSYKNQDTTLTGWTKSIAAGSILRFNVDSCNTITRATINLKVTTDQ